MWSLFSSGTLPQWGTFASLLGIFSLALTAWIKGIPERLRVQNEREAQDTKAASDIRDEYAIAYKETRLEVHALRNELARVRAELLESQARSTRRGDKMNMLRFILEMVLTELQAKEPANKVLEQARKLLARVEDEPHQTNASEALSAAEDTVDAARATVRKVKADEAKK